MIPSATVRETRERVLDAAVRLVVEQGWSEVTMTQVAGTAGVSRQTVYNEVGTKPQLAQSLIEREMEQFTHLVTDAFDRHPDDLVEAVRLASSRVLERARRNPLLVAVVSATHGADTELLPYLTTRSSRLLEGSKAVVRERVAAYEHALDDVELETVIDLLVRTVLSHVMQPTGEPDETAAGIAWLAGALVGVPTGVPRARPAEGGSGRE